MKESIKFMLFIIAITITCYAINGFELTILLVLALILVELAEINYKIKDQNESKS